MLVIELFMKSDSCKSPLAKGGEFGRPSGAWRWSLRKWSLSGLFSNLGKKDESGMGLRGGENHDVFEGWDYEAGKTLSVRGSRYWTEISLECFLGFRGKASWWK